MVKLCQTSDKSGALRTTVSFSERTFRFRRRCSTVRLVCAAVAVVACLVAIAWIASVSRFVINPGGDRETALPRDKAYFTAERGNSRQQPPSSQPGRKRYQFHGCLYPGTLPALVETRTYDGDRLDFGGIISGEDRGGFEAPKESQLCERWAVLSSATSAYYGESNITAQLSSLDGWCVVIVGDTRQGDREDHNAPRRVRKLYAVDQDALPYRIASLMPRTEFGRKNLGYMYAIHHGAKVIYDIGLDSTLIRPKDKIPYTDPLNMYAASSLAPAFAAGPPPSVVHNPYPCFGGPRNAWPRGFPLDAIVDDPGPSRCELETADGAKTGPWGKKRKSIPLGVVQSLANHEPDVDSVYRMSILPGTGEMPFDFEGFPAKAGSVAAGKGRGGGRGGGVDSDLRIVPATAFSPYNAQATLHFYPAFWGMLLPVTVSERVGDIWRGYFTQALLPATRAVVAFAPPWVKQARKDRSHRDHFAEFRAELPLYQQSGALVAYLAEYRQRLQAIDDATRGNASVTLIPERLQALAIAMYERGVLGKRDVALTQAWLQDLVSAGYVFELPKVLLVGAMGGGGNVRHDGEAAAAAPRPQGNTDYSSGQQGLFSSHAKEALDSAEEETRQEEAAAVEGGSATGADAGTPDLVEKNKKQEAMPSQEGARQDPSGTNEREEYDGPRTLGTAAVMDPHVADLDGEQQPLLTEVQHRRVNREEKECVRMREQLQIITNQTWDRANKLQQRRWAFLACNSVPKRDGSERQAVRSAWETSEATEAAVSAATAREGLNASVVHEKKRRVGGMARREHGRETSTTEPIAAEVGVDDGHAAGSGGKELGGGEDPKQGGNEKRTVAGVIPQMPNARSAPKVQVLLVIAVVSARPERRTAIRDSWLAWRDDRVVLRFFTEQLDDTFGRPENQTAEAKALVEESSAHGDVVVLDIDHGMNFGLKLVSAMRYALDRYDFDFFLRLDDSYFLCLRRLLDELSALMRGVTANDAPHAPSQRMLYAGHRYCERNATRIDEAYMLVSGALVRRVMSTPGLRCSSQEGTSAGRRFTVGHGVNRAGDVRWVHDPRLDHDGDWWRPPRAGGAARSDYASVCEKHIGVHRAFPERMAGLWAVVSQQKTTKSGEDLAGSSSAVAFEYVQDVKCEHTPQGMSPARHARDKAQPCEVFHG